MLQSHTPQAHKTVRVSCTERCDFLILNLDDFASEVQIRPIPKRVDGDGLDIDSHLVHVGQAFVDTVYVRRSVVGVCLLHVASAALTTDTVLEQVPDIGNLYVAMAIDR